MGGRLILPSSELYLGQKMSMDAAQWHRTMPGIYSDHVGCKKLEL